MLENKLRAKIILWQVLFLVCNHLLKWKSFPFRLLTRVVQICVYLCVVWFQYHPFKSILSFSKCMSRPNEAFRGHSGPRTELLRYLDFLPGVIPWPYIHCKPHRHVPAQRIWFLRFFGLKPGIHFAHFGLELGVVFERKKRRVSTYLSFQFQIKE